MKMKRLPKKIVLYKMRPINLYKCGWYPSKKEKEKLLKSLRPRQMLPSSIAPEEDYIYQLVSDNYLDMLLKGYTLKFLMDRCTKEFDGVTRLIDVNERFQSIALGIREVIRSRELDLQFEWTYEGFVLHNFKRLPKSFDPMKLVGFKINGNKIECHDHDGDRGLCWVDD